MSDPITHATNLSPWVVAALTSAASFLFDLPLGVVITAAGGAYWAVYRNPSLSFLSSFFVIIAGAAVASALVPGVVWLFAEVFGFKNMPLRPLAFLLGFAVVDKPTRDWVTEFLKSKLGGMEVKK